MKKGYQREYGKQELVKLKMIKIVINKKTPTVNHLYYHKRNMKILTKEAKDLRYYIDKSIQKQKIDVENYKDKKLKVIVKIYENWLTKKGLIARKDISNREKFFVDSVFKSLGLDDKCIWEHRMIKKQDESKEQSIIFIEVLSN